MTTTVHQPKRRDLLGTAAETVARLAGLEARSDALTVVPGPARGTGSDWNCLVHVPGASLPSWVAETVRFGGRRRRHEAARLAYDVLWAGHGVGELGDEPF